MKFLIKITLHVFSLDIFFYEFPGNDDDENGEGGGGEDG